MYDSFIQISVRLHAVLTYSNQVTSSGREHTMLCTCLTLTFFSFFFFPSLLRPLPPLLEALQSRLLCAAPLMALAGGNLLSCWVCTTVHRHRCCRIVQSAGVSCWLTGLGGDGRGTQNKLPAKWWRAGRAGNTENKEGMSNSWTQCGAVFKYSDS